MTEDDVLKVIGALFNLRGRGMQTQDWMSYGGVNTRADTLISRGRLRIISFANQLPMGPLWSLYAADWLIGDDFNRGVLHNTLSGLMAPSTGTYAGSFQNLQNRQMVSALRAKRLQYEKDLRTDFVTNYYMVTAEMTRAKAEKEAASAGSLSLPRILNYIVDPASNEKTLKGIKGVQAGFLSWNLRMNTRQHFGLESGPATTKEIADALGDSIVEMAKLANRRALGYQTGGEHFGGFVGSEVSELANILANASQLIKPLSYENDIKKFLEKVKKTAQALSPLKDIFGRDVKAMVDMLQDITGQNISQLTPLMIKSLSASTVDLSRYSGASVAQMAQAGRSLLAMSANMGGTTFSRIGASSLGGYYSALMAAGNAPAGVHAAEYAASTQRALTSAQASQGADWASMAYAIWKNKKNPNGTILDFLLEVSKNRANGAPDMMTALVNAAGVKSQEQLLAGKQYVEYRTAAQSGKMAQLGIEEQYRTYLKDTMWGLTQRNSLFAEDYSTLLQYMSNPANAGAIHRLVTHANDKTVIDEFARKAGVRAGAINTFLSSRGALLYTSRYASQLNIRQYTAVQAEIRKAMLPLEGGNAGGMYTLWKAIGDGTWREQAGNYVIEGPNGETAISQIAMDFLAQGVLGVTGKEKIDSRIQTLKKQFGTRTYEMLATASDRIKEDPAYRESLITLSEGLDKAKYEKLNDKLKALYKKNYTNALLKVLSVLAGVSSKDLKDETAKSIWSKAVDTYWEGGNTEADSEVLKKAFGLAARVQRASLMDLGAFEGKSDEEKKKSRQNYVKLLNASGSLELLTKAQFEAKNLDQFGYSYLQYEKLHKETNSSYNLERETFRVLKTVGEAVLKLFSQKGWPTS